MSHVTKCPGCAVDLEIATHSVLARGTQRGMLTSCCRSWLSEDLLFSCGIALSPEADLHDLVLIEP